MSTTSGARASELDRDHRPQAVSEHDATREVEIIRELGDLGCERGDRILARRLAVAMGGQIDRHHMVGSGEMIELRSEESTITAPAVQRQHRRNTAPGLVERKSGTSHLRTSKIRLNGVSVARRNRENPAPSSSSAHRLSGT